MIGGAQNINLASGCGFGTTIHEILHAAGIYHEQSREDRNDHVVIHWTNINFIYASNFYQHITNATDYGNYDYNSVMHYGSYDFSINGEPTITTIPPGIPIGQRSGLSTGDIATVNTMYPVQCGNTCPANRTITTIYNSGSNTDLEASNTITASSIINNSATVDYDAGVQIDLVNGFHAQYGCDFDAFIDGCGGALIVSGNNNDDFTFDNSAQMLKTTTFATDEVALRNYPNPFTGTTTIEYTLPQGGKVSMMINDLSGKTVAYPLQDKAHEAGIHTLQFDATTLSAGIYFCTLQTTNTVKTHKITLFE